MNEIRELYLIAISTPIYLFIIVTEMVFSKLNNYKLYSARGIYLNLVMMTINLAIDFLMRGFCLAVLDYFFRYSFHSFQGGIMYWLLLLISQDLMFYLLHVADHYCRVFWAVHVTHHSSEEFNLTVGFRSSVFQPLYRFIYFIPLALAGFQPVDILLMYSLTQIYGILVHTQTVGKLGFLEYFLVTPSHHRVHHACNPQYLDKNMGMVFIIWDRLFGTFQEEKEDEPVQFGLTTNPYPQNTTNLLFHEWRSIARDVRRPLPFSSKLRYIFDKPGWSHDGSRQTSRQLLESKINESLSENQPENSSSLSSVPSKTA